MTIGFTHQESRVLFLKSLYHPAVFFLPTLVFFSRLKRKGGGPGKKKKKRPRPKPRPSAKTMSFPSFSTGDHHGPRLLPDPKPRGSRPAEEEEQQPPAAAATTAPTIQIDDLIGPEERLMLTVWNMRMHSATLSPPSPDAPPQQDPFAAALRRHHVALDAVLPRSEYSLDPTYVRYVAGRTRQIDAWTREFLKRHQFEDAVVLQLACGLDHRYLRVLGPGGAAGVKWIDVDRPRVAGLRRRLLPEPPGGDYELVGALVGGDEDDDAAWLARVPADRPALIIMESLTYYLEPAQGLRLLRRLLAHFERGNIVCDTFGSVAVAFGGLMPPFKGGKSPTIKWGIDDAEDLTKLDGRLVLRDRVYSHEYMSAGWFAKGYPPMFGGWTPLISLLPKSVIVVVLVCLHVCKFTNVTVVSYTDSRSMASSFTMSFEASRYQSIALMAFGVCISCWERNWRCLLKTDL